MRRMAFCFAVSVAPLLPARASAQVDSVQRVALVRRLDSLQALADSLRSQIADVRRILLGTPAAPTVAAEVAIAAATTADAIEADPSLRFTPRPRMKTANCQQHGALPDLGCTPGAVMTRDARVICNTATGPRRNVTHGLRVAAFAAYATPFPPPQGSTELDHLIPLELGGDNTIENLWPEPAAPNPGFHEKDRVENDLHKRFCNGELTLDQAQAIIVNNWLAYFQKHLLHHP